VRAEVPHLLPYYLGQAMWRKGIGLLQIQYAVGVVADRFLCALPLLKWNN